MILDYSDNAVFTLVDHIRSLRNYCVRIDWYDGLTYLQSKDVVVEDLRWDNYQLLLDYRDWDDESCDPVGPIQTIDLWDPDNAGIRIFIY